jgi:Ca-activated chloride channel family protein
MFRFAHPEFLYLLLLIPLLIGYHIFINRRKKKDMSSFGTVELMKQLTPHISPERIRIKLYIRVLIVGLFSIIVARPQFGSKLQNVKRKGIEIIVALDVSNSMMAEDVNPNRLERSKQILSKLIDDASNDKFGLIVFAGDAYTQVPITSDYVSAKMFLSSISPSLIARQGTAIGTAIDLAVSSFGPENGIGRAVVVITDGENHEDNAVEAAKVAAEKGIVVHVVGIGKPEGSPIPMEGTMSFRKDKQGNVVVSRLNEEMCNQIAKTGKGVYVRADNTNGALRVLKKELDKMAKADIETKVYAEYNEQYQVFAWFLLLLLIVDVLLPERQNKWLDKIKLFK